MSCLSWLKSKAWAFSSDHDFWRILSAAEGLDVFLLLLFIQMYLVTINSDIYFDCDSLYCAKSSKGWTNRGESKILITKQTRELPNVRFGFRCDYFYVVKYICKIKWILLTALLNTADRNLVDLFGTCFTCYYYHYSNFMIYLDLAQCRDVIRDSLGMWWYTITILGSLYYF